MRKSREIIQFEKSLESIEIINKYPPPSVNKTPREKRAKYLKY